MSTPGISTVAASLGRRHTAAPNSLSLNVDAHQFLRGPECQHQVELITDSAEL
jgi:hypothetical protein